MKKKRFQKNKTRNKKNAKGTGQTNWTQLSWIASDSVILGEFFVYLFVVIIRGGNGFVCLPKKKNARIFDTK